MSASRNQITLMLIFESGKAPVSIKLAKWVYILVAAAVALLVIVSVVGTINYARLSYESAERESLARENEELRRMNNKIVVLEENLQAYRQMLKQVATLAGVDLSAYGMNSDSATVTAALNNGRMTALSNLDLATPESTTRQDTPTGWPVAGYVSRTFRPTADNPKTRHLGLDIAVKTGTPVRATADGAVAFAGWDATFGWMVVVKHASDVETMYGHMDTLLVTTGQSLRFGQTLGLSGNTGVSSAPHVHYEVRVRGQAVNPEDHYGKTNH